MVVVKFLERKDVIRWFGIALILAPFFNKVISVSLLTNVGNPFNFRLIMAALATESLYDHALSVSSIIIGVLMVRGATLAWKYVLILLGAYIGQQTLNLGQNIKSNGLVGIIYLLNIGVFIFIADQLVWKIKVNFPKISPVLKKIQSQKQILIHFDGIGPWAKLVSISSDTVQIRGLTSPPAGLESQEVEIRISNGLKIQVRLLRQDGNDFFFGYQKLTPPEIQLLNQWLQKQAA